MTLACFLEERRGKQHNLHLPLLTQTQILSWADAHFDRTGTWPQKSTGRIQGSVRETWHGVDAALRIGLRGLRGGSSLAMLLDAKRQVRNIGNLPTLTEWKILTWADAHYCRTGRWPIVTSGAVAGQLGENWKTLDSALRVGTRGLPGGSSLAILLERTRGAQNRNRPKRLTISMILKLADNHRFYTGEWPSSESGPVIDDPNETWGNINAALVGGFRGLSAGNSIAKLLAKYRGKRNKKDLPRLTQGAVVKWAIAHHRRTGKWPTQKDGEVQSRGAEGEKWRNIDSALVHGCRGFPGGSSLAKLLDKHARK